MTQPVVTQLLQSQKIGPLNRGMDQYVGNVSMKVSNIGRTSVSGYKLAFFFDTCWYILSSVASRTTSRCRTS
jgi:hypothetical protein